MLLLCSRHRRTCVRTLTCAALAFVAVCVPANASQSPAIPGRYIVVLKDAVSNPTDVARAHGADPTHVYQDALKGYAAALSATRAAELRRDPRVEFLVPDRPLDVLAASKPVSHPPQALPTGFDRVEAERSSTAARNGLGGVGVAVIDTGINPHSDLNLAGGVNCTGSGKATDYSDYRGHGTHVAGTVGARDNGIGVVGVAPAVPIYSVRVLDRWGQGTLSTAACGVDWVTRNTATVKVANMSVRWWSGDDGNCGASNADPLHKAICASVKAGVTYVVAAGNEGQSATYSPLLDNNAPASYDEVLTVTAIADFNGAPGGGAPSTCRADVDDTAADFSSYTLASSPDAAHVIAAPGACINSTYLNNGYSVMSGTSMASPHVAGAAALCLAAGGACTDRSPAGVIAKLRADAEAASPAASATEPLYYGFAGDPQSPPQSPSDGRVYGNLLHVGAL